MLREGWSSTACQPATTVDVPSMEYIAERKWSGKWGDKFWDIAFAATHLSLELLCLLSLWGGFQLQNV